MNRLKWIKEKHTWRDNGDVERVKNRDIDWLIAEVERLRNGLEGIINTPLNWEESYDKAYTSVIRKAVSLLKE